MPLLAYMDKRQETNIYYDSLLIYYDSMNKHTNIVAYTETLPKRSAHYIIVLNMHITLQTWRMHIYDLQRSQFCSNKNLTNQKSSYH